jgi:hypothetical protein
LSDAGLETFFWPRKTLKNRLALQPLEPRKTLKNRFALQPPKRSGGQDRFTITYPNENSYVQGNLGT